MVDCFNSGRSEGEPIVLARPAIGHEADTSEAKDHHRPSGGLRDGRNRDVVEDQAQIVAARVLERGFPAVVVVKVKL